MRMSVCVFVGLCVYVCTYQRYTESRPKMEKVSECKKNSHQRKVRKYNAIKPTVGQKSSGGSEGFRVVHIRLYSLYTGMTTVKSE